MTEKEFEKYCIDHLVWGCAREALRRRWEKEGRLEKPAPPKPEFKPLDPDIEGILIERMSFAQRQQYEKDKAEYLTKKKQAKNIYQRGVEILWPNDPKPKRAEDYEGFTFIKPKPRKQSEAVEIMSDGEIDELAGEIAALAK